MGGRSSMSKRSQSSDEEIWSKRFDEEYENPEYISRSERSRSIKHRGMSPMLTGTVIFLALLILSTIFYYVWYSNRVDDPNLAAEAEIEVVNNEEEDAIEEASAEADPDPESEVDSESEQEPETESDVESDVSSESQTETEPEANSNPNPAAETESDPEQEADTEPESVTTSDSEVAGNTYTVKAGDNMFRIALNHGMSLDEIKELNGLTDETVYVGQVLKVK